MSFEDYKLIKRIGRGAFGIVHLAQNLKTDEMVALKAYREDVDWENIEESLELAMKINHPNLMKCFTFFSDRITKSVHLFTALEYIPGVTLSSLAGDKNIIEKLNIYLPQIISGIKYLHSHQMMHRDIKADNILVERNVAKIIDYDFLIDASKNIPRSRMGTPLYMAPEIYQADKYGYKTDNWALGVTLYYCIKAEYPFVADDKPELKKLILSDYIPDYSNILGNYKQIIQGLLVKDPKKRMSLNEVLFVI